MTSASSSIPLLKNLESLTQSERESYDRLVSLLHPTGVCINVMVNVQAWDVRPLFLDRGIVWIYRISQELTETQCSALLRSFAAAAQGLLDTDTTFGKVPDVHRMWVRRRYYQTTLIDDVRSGKFPDKQRASAVIKGLIGKVEQLHARGEVHGHIWLGNLALIDSEIRVLDPVLGTFPRPIRSGLPDLAPEVSKGSSDLSSDVFGIAAVALNLFGELLAPEERVKLEGVLSSPPARRPRLSEILSVVLPPSVGTADSQTPPSRTATLGSGGKVIGVGATSRPSVTQVESPSASKSSLSFEVPGSRIAPQPSSSLLHYAKTNPIISALVALSLVVVAVRYGAPAAYYRVARIFPFIDRQVDVALENDWASGDRNRMRAVASEAVVTRRPAAENAIVSSALGGSKSTAFDPNVIRVAYDERWADDLAERDRRSALALAVRQLLPEGLAYLSPLETLHPGVILAVAGQMDFIDPPQHLSAVMTEELAALPSPIGDLFSALSKVGVKTLNQPGALAACHIATGAVSSGVVEAYFGNKSELGEVFPRLAAMMVVIDQSRELGDATAAALKAGGGEVGQALGWFDAEDLSQWAGLSGASRLSLLLGKLPRNQLSLEQYADLLLYPLPAVRTEALKALIRQYLTEKSAPMLAVIASDQSRLTRKQVVALVAALHLKTDSAGSFVSVWFQTAPDPLTVLRLLNARSTFDVPDTFNLEAARYLRKSTWQGSFEDLKTLSAHPEPLARSLAYAKLSVSIPGEADLLKSRLKLENDASLRAVLEQRLGGGDR